VRRRWAPWLDKIGQHFGELRTADYGLAFSHTALIRWARSPEIPAMVSSRLPWSRNASGENLDPYSKFDWGMMNGKLSALRWVLGDDWDMLDT
jgi:hypothetical protein